MNASKLSGSKSKKNPEGPRTSVEKQTLLPGEGRITKKNVVNKVDPVVPPRPIGRLYTMPQLLEPERVTIETKEQFPKYNPGEMVLRLTPAAIVTPTAQNPMGLHVAVIQFLAMLRREYDLWRIELLVQTGAKLWNLGISPSGPIPNKPGHLLPSNKPYMNPPPIAEATFGFHAKGISQDGKDLYPCILYGENASLVPGPIRVGDLWRPPPSMPSPSFSVRENISISPERNIELRSRLMLRFDPVTLTDDRARDIIRLADGFFAVPGRSGLFKSIERTPARYIAEPPALNFVDEGGPKPAAKPTLKSKVSKSDAATAKIPEIYPLGWQRESINRPASFDDEVVTIAVLDSGVDELHPSLAGAISFSPTYKRSDRSDDAGHGTHVCSIIVGRADVPDPWVSNSATYPIGILPKSKVLSYKVMDPTTTKANGKLHYFVNTVFYSTALDDLSVQSGIGKTLRVVNISLGGTMPMAEHEKEDLQKLTDLGCIIVASAGNHENTWDFSGVLYPAAYFNVLSVGAYRREPKLDVATQEYNLLPYKWEASNVLGTLNEHVGRSSVDIYAPGRNVIACVPIYLSLMEFQVQIDFPNIPRFRGKTPLSGTSMAAPIMSATLAVYLSRRAALSTLPAESLLDIVKSFRDAAVLCVNWEKGLSVSGFFPKSPSGQ